jgi:hypothetical protein
MAISDGDPVALEFPRRCSNEKRYSRNMKDAKGKERRLPASCSRVAWIWRRLGCGCGSVRL